MSSPCLHIDQKEDGTWEVVPIALPDLAVESNSLCDVLSNLAVRLAALALASRGVPPSDS